MCFGTEGGYFERLYYNSANKILMFISYYFNIPVTRNSQHFINGCIMNSKECGRKRS
jgi:hypothetical protein